MSGIGEHWFWWSVTMACVVWYSTITVYVTIKGAIDIRGMLKRLGALQGGQTAELASAEKR